MAFNIGSGLNGSGFVISVDSNNNAYVGGSFTTYNGVTSHFIIKLDPNGYVDSTFNVGNNFYYQLNDCVDAIAIDEVNEKIYIGGKFTSYSGQTCNNIISLNYDGSINTDFDYGTGFNGAVYSIYHDSIDDLIYVGGNFTSYNGITGNSVNQFTCLNSDGSRYTGFTHSLSTIVSPVDGRITRYNNKIYYTCSYITPIEIIRFNLDGTVDNTFSYDSNNYQINAAHDFRINDDGSLYVCGFPSGIPSDTGLIKLNSTGGTDSSFTSLLYSERHRAMEIVGDYMYVLSDSGRYDGTNPYCIAKIAFDGTKDLAFSGTGFNNNLTNPPDIFIGMSDIKKRSDNKLLIVGDFIKYNEVQYSRIILIDASGNSETITRGVYQATGITTSNVTCSTIDFDWINNETEFIDNTVIQYYSGSTWYTVATLASGVTSTTVTGLTPNTAYQFRFGILYSDVVYPSATIINESTFNFNQPTGLTGTTIINGIQLQWTNSLSNGDNILIYRGKNLGVKTLIDTISYSANTYTDYNIEYNMNYQYIVYSIGCGGYLHASNEFSILSPELFLLFCEQSPLPIITSASTCGNADGKLIITTTGFFKFYNFQLTNILDNTTYSFNELNGESTGLTSGWYILSATVKPEYWNYTRETCQFDWVKIEDSDTPMSLTSVSTRQAQCGPFDQQFGRIFYNVSGTSTGNTYSFYAFKDDLSLYYSKTGITSTDDFIINNASANCYYGLIIDEVSGCKLLLDVKCVTSIPVFSLGGIKKLYIASWSDDIDYNYWKDSDDDFFLEFEDTSFFYSTKIKEYQSLSGGSIQWYEIPVENKVVKLTQTLAKVREGFIFTDVLNVAIPKANALKWKSISTLLNPENKWFGIIIDANNNAWTFGYKHGASVSTYQYKSGARTEDNGYSLSFESISENKILTAIDKDYINTYVI